MEILKTVKPATVWSCGAGRTRPGRLVRPEGRRQRVSLSLGLVKPGVADGGEAMDTPKM